MGAVHSTHPAKAMLEKIAAAIEETNRSTRRMVVVEPFVAFLDEEDATPWQSIALPMAADEVTSAHASAAVKELRRVFSNYSRGLRFELFDALYPRLIVELERAGLVERNRQPVMTCHPGDLVPHAGAGMDVWRLGADDPDEALAAFLRVQRVAFGEKEARDGVEPGIGFLRRDMRNGRLRCAMALSEGREVAAAAIVGIGSVAELAGVGTLPEMRRRGAASSASVALLEAHFAGSGDFAWLTAGDDTAAGVYTLLGFRHADACQVNLEDRR